MLSLLINLLEGNTLVTDGDCFQCLKEVKYILLFERFSSRKKRRNNKIKKDCS
jgi:hypothetical protein